MSSMVNKLFRANFQNDNNKQSPVVDKAKKNLIKIEFANRVISREKETVSI